MIRCHPVTSDCAAALLRVVAPPDQCHGLLSKWEHIKIDARCKNWVGMRFRRSVILVICEFLLLTVNTSSAAVMGARPTSSDPPWEGVFYVAASCNDWAGICSASDAVSSWSSVRLPELTVDAPSSSEWMGSGGRISPHPVGKVYFLKHRLHCTYLRCSAG